MSCRYLCAYEWRVCARARSAGVFVCGERECVRACACRIAQSIGTLICLGTFV
jgi:hypothetical protein